jgi:thymidine phosphorylase
MAEYAARNINQLQTTAIIEEFIRGHSGAAMDHLIMAFRQPDISDKDVAELALRLAESGERLRYTGSQPTADVPSTGGPSSLSTLLSPLVLVMAGAAVPKLGIPGRPAGGVDTLACIPGFNPHLTISDVRRCLASCGYAHFLAGASFAPLDAILFAHRRSVGAIDVPSLAIASLLSKKLAVGVDHVTLDVRIASHTNFGSTWDEGRNNAERFIRVARILGIGATCFLTDATMPYQPFIGRGESLVALARIFSAEQPEDLAAHVTLCTEMARSCLGRNITPHPEDLERVFRSHLEQQGTNWTSFISRVRDIESQPTAIITADTDGYFNVDLDGIRRSLFSRQEATKSAREQFPDPCGVTLLLPCGTLVSKGDALARIRSAESLDELVVEVRPSIRQSMHALTRRATEEVVANVV